MVTGRSIISVKIILENKRDIYKKRVRDEIKIKKSTNVNINLCIFFQYHIRIVFIDKKSTIPYKNQLVDFEKK